MQKLRLIYVPIRSHNNEKINKYFPLCSSSHLLTFLQLFHTNLSEIDALLPLETIDITKSSILLNEYSIVATRIPLTTEEIVACNFKKNIKLLTCLFSKVKIKKQIKVTYHYDFSLIEK